MPRETVRDYYAALRAGDPLGRFFAPGEDVVKVGISERLVGHDAVVRGLEEQTETTADWTVESRDLRVRRRGDTARFDDVVTLEWTDTERAVRRAFETRWSGSLASLDAGWRFTGMHVSAPHDV